MIRSRRMALHEKRRHVQPGEQNGGAQPHGTATADEDWNVNRFHNASPASAAGIATSISFMPEAIALDRSNWMLPNTISTSSMRARTAPDREIGMMVCPRSSGRI